MVRIELTQPLVCHLLPASASLRPNDIEIPLRAKVLSYPHRVSYVEDGVPPAVGYIDCFPSILRELVTRKVLVIASTAAGGSTALDTGEDEVEVVHGLVVLVLPGQTFSFRNVLWYLGRKEDPALLAVEERVPRCRAERIDVNTGTAPLRPDEEPPIRRTAPLAHQMEQIFVEVRRYRIVPEELLAATVLVEGAVKDVERRTVAIVPQI